jgi:hypothetical protein
MVIKFNCIGCGMGGVLLMIDGSSGCGLHVRSWSCTGKVGAYDVQRAMLCTVTKPAISVCKMPC